MRDNIYEDYYLQQAGSGMPVYSGVETQRGHGLGSILGGFMRSAVPLLKSVGKAVGKQVLRSGMDVASDVISGSNVKQAVKNRAREGAMSLLNRARNTTTVNSAKLGGLRTIKFYPSSAVSGFREDKVSALNID